LFCRFIIFVFRFIIY